MASSSSSNSNNIWNYDVFLSFRGLDTRNTFIGHLYQALRDKGINVFIDNELKRGEVITSQLLRVIEESRISIIVLSENYASSSFCLDEFVKILECRESKWQCVVPVFYHVDPTDVEKQRGIFGREFAKFEAQFNKPNIEGDLIYWKFVPAKALVVFRYALKWMRYVLPIIGMLANEVKNEGATTQNWRSALTKVATLSGFHLREGDHESSTLQSIIKLVLKQLNHIPLHVAEHPIGLASRLNHILEKFNMESDEVCMFGLHGMGGIGKTTTAKALYNKCVTQIQFDGSCFLLNVRETSKKYGLAQLQQNLLYQILGGEKCLFGNFDEGIELIKKRLRGKKVLIVIDDVECSEQLNKLVGGLEWFRAGSKIIITTRDLHLLKVHRVKKIYKIKKLKDHEAIELFKSYAFKKNQPSEAFAELSHHVVSYAQGLPLALQVLGGLVYGRSVSYWEAVLEKLKKCLPKDITNILKINYDDLDGEEKSIFLDIAFFFKGKARSEVTKFLDACGFSALVVVERLIEKSLIYTYGGVILEMHNLLKEMRTQIACDEYSRLCIEKREDIDRLFFKDKSGYDVQILLLDFDDQEEKVPLNFLENLTKLRILVIRKGRFTKMPKKLPQSIKWLEWYNYPLTTEFLPTGLLVLQMPRNIIKKAPSKVQKLMNLTRINLDGCIYLSKTVDFSAIPNLQKLDLSRCEKLEKIKFIGKKLEELYLYGCSSLTSLPNLVENQCLAHIDLQKCSKLEKLPNLPKSLERLVINNSGIKEIPWFVGNLVNLASFSAENCKNIISVSENIYNLPSVTFFYVGNCPNLPRLPESESSMFSVVGMLNLSGNKFVSLPTNFSKFSKLWFLYLRDCEWLVEIPELPPSLLSLEASNCKSLARFSQFQFDHFYGDFGNCHKLPVKNEMENWRKMLENEEQVNRWKSYDLIFPRNEIPEWFEHVIEFEGNDPSFKLPPSISNHNVIGIAWCAIFQPNIDTVRNFHPKTLKFEFRMGEWSTNLFLHSLLESEHMWLGFTNDAIYWLKLLQGEIFCKFYCDPIEAVAFKRLGLHSIYKS